MQKGLQNKINEIILVEKVKVYRACLIKTSISHQDGVIWLDGNLFPITLMHENQEQDEFAPQYQVKLVCSSGTLLTKDTNQNHLSKLLKIVFCFEKNRVFTVYEII